MNVVVIEAPNFMQTPTRGIVLFANRLGLDMYRERWLLRDYAGEQFNTGLADAIERHTEQRLHSPDTPELEALTVVSPNGGPGFRLPAIVYAMADDFEQPVGQVYLAGLREANRAKLQYLTIPLYSWGCLIDDSFMGLLHGLRGALSLQARASGNTITQVIVAVDSPEARKIVVDDLSAVFYDVC